MSKLLPRTWYLVAAGLMICAASIAIIAWTQMGSRVEGLQRVVMPGSAKLTVPAGVSTLYFERESVVEGKAYSTPGPFTYQCDFVEKGNVELRPSPGKVSYSISGFSGRNAFDVDTKVAGDYTLQCSSQNNQQFVLAFGRGVGSAVVVAVVALFPFLLGVAGVLAIYLIRRKQLRRAST